MEKTQATLKIKKKLMIILFFYVNILEKDSLFIIGRDNYYDDIMDDNLLSRVHCIILYKIGIGWFN